MAEATTNTISIFEQGTRAKLRFQHNGMISIEDLWGLKVESLNNIAVSLHTQLQQTNTLSFIEQPTKETETLQLMFDIVKRVLDVKLAEQEQLKSAKERKALKQEILEVLQEKRAQDLRNKSVEELEALAKELA